METIKNKIQSFQKRIEDLEQKINVQSKSISTISEFISPSEEFFEINIEEDLQFFRFIFYKQGEYFIYILLNPTKLMKELVTDIHGNETNICLKSFIKDPYDINDSEYEIEENDYFIKNPNSKKIIKEELGKYFFRVSDICNCEIRPVNFDEEITLHFKNEYKCLPHFSMFTTPFHQNNITYKVKNMTTEYITIQFSFAPITGEKLKYYQYRKNLYETPENLKLHLHIRGVPNQKEVDLLGCL